MGRGLRNPASPPFHTLHPQTAELVGVWADALSLFSSFALPGLSSLAVLSPDALGLGVNGGSACGLGQLENVRC